MNEDTRKNQELREEDMEQVSGGSVPREIPTEWKDALPVDQLPDGWVQE